MIINTVAGPEMIVPACGAYSELCLPFVTVALICCHVTACQCLLLASVICV